MPIPNYKRFLLEDPLSDSSDDSDSDYSQSSQSSEVN